MNEARHITADGLRGTLRHNVGMSRHTSWRAGGCAEHVYQPADLADLAAFLRTLPAQEPLLAVGLGSNLLVRDGGLRGTVLLMHAALNELRIEADSSVHAQAGIPGAKLARFAALHDLGGAEFFAGIPGTVGGMLAMNAGCYGSETWDVVTRVQVMDRNGALHERTAADYEIGYRRVVKRETGNVKTRPEAEVSRNGQCEKRDSFHVSPFTFHPEEFFVGAWFSFAAGDGDVAREKIKELLNKRSASQPLNLPNAGSVFRNPPGDYAARLIEQCGLKGKQIGGAQVSEKHANFIVNMGKATATDIENLIGEIQATVEEKTGIRLHSEVKIVGEKK